MINKPPPKLTSARDSEVLFTSSSSIILVRTYILPSHTVGTYVGPTVADRYEYFIFQF